MKRRCEWCGRDIPKGRFSTTRFCGRKCRYNAWYKKKYALNLGEKDCAWCGEKFSPYQKNQVTCRDSCRKYLVTFEDQIDKGYQTVCIQCGGPIWPLRWNKKFCSTKCRNDHNHGRTRKSPVCCLICGQTNPPMAKNYCSVKCNTVAKNERAAVSRSSLSDMYIAALVGIQQSELSHGFIGAYRELLRLKRFIANGDDRTPLGANRKVDK